MPGEGNKNLVRRFIQAINRGDHAVLDHVLARNFTRHCQATPGVDVRTAEAFKAFDRESRGTFSDQQIVLERLIAEGEYVACWCRYQGTQDGPLGPYPPSGRTVDVEFGGYFRVEDGRLAETWVTWDNVALLQQLGHLPPSGSA